LENTGFSEISAERLRFAGSGFWFCEIAVTGACNFACRYCNGLAGQVDLRQICDFVDDHAKTLRHIHLTGGEPTLYGGIIDLCDHIRTKGIRLGISTNGSAEHGLYERLDPDRLSISLDDFDDSILVSKGYRNPVKIRDNIRRLSTNRHVDVGLVVDSLNCSRVEQIVDYILGLGVADIKLSVSTKDEVWPVFGATDYSRYPILNYRVGRFRSGKGMRGIAETEDFKCALVKNDIGIVGDRHYPCLVYAREKGKHIGVLGGNVMEERRIWHDAHQPSTDPICSMYCMDFKCEFNREHHKMSARKTHPVGDA